METDRSSSSGGGGAIGGGGGSKRKGKAKCAEVSLPGMESVAAAKKRKKGALHGFFKSKPRATSSH